MMPNFAPKCISPVRSLPQVQQRDLSQQAQISSEAERIGEKFKVSPLFSKLLAQRGFKADQVLENYLCPLISKSLPAIHRLKGLRAAVDLLVSAVETGERVALIPDFDADGTTSASSLVQAFRKLGVRYTLQPPDRRSEGHGFSIEQVDLVKKKGCTTIVVLDCGTHDTDAIKYAKKKGMNVIIVDHHQAPAVSARSHPADALINPKQKGCGFAEQDLCTAGLAWVLTKGLVTRLLSHADPKIRKQARSIKLEELLAYVAIGSVADVVSLHGANRALVREGLHQLAVSKLPGIRKLVQISGAGPRITAADIGFRIAPLLNAISRMGAEFPAGKNAAMIMVELLTAKQLGLAEKLVEQADVYNKERRKIERKMLREALKMIEAQGGVGDAIVLSSPNFLRSVNGIVAARLAERFKKPAFIFTTGSAGTANGSARSASIPGIDIGAAFREVQDLLSKHGGHTGAGGCSLLASKLPEFAARIAEVCKNQRTGDPLQEAEIELSVAEIKQWGVAFVNELSLLEPIDRFKNPAPRFMIRGAVVVNSWPVGKNHLRVWLRQGDQSIDAMLWRDAKHPALVQGATVDLVCEINVKKRHAEFNLKEQRPMLSILSAA